jgi:conjugal transfer mating pair stabilization protein TraN
MQSSQAAECVKTGTVCAEGAATRNINGTNVYKDCWRYEDSYSCTTVQGVKSCEQFSTRAGCGQKFTECLEKGIDGQCIRFSKNYTCSVDIKPAYGGVLPEGVTELAPTHKITSEWQEADCNAKIGTFSSCKQTANTCTDGVSERVVNGVKVSFPCWEESREYQCLKKETNSTCDSDELNDKCVLKRTDCINSLNGECQVGDKVFQCLLRPGSTSDSSACKDPDFGKVMAGMEAAREFSRYFDENSMTFFKGDTAMCTVKLGGSIGGNCCKPSGDPNKWTDAAISAGVNYAIDYALASTYTYTILLTEASSMVGSVAVAAGATATASVATTATAGVSVGASASGSMVLMVNPAMLVAAIIIMVVMAWLECDPEEKKTALRNKAKLCVHVGSYCKSKVLGACITEAQSYCCYVSKLARMINVQGRAQISKPYVGIGSDGVAYTTENPNCSGFNQAELERLDFAKLDLEEFIADLVHITPDNNAITGSAEKTAEDKVKATNEGNYYGQP